MRGIYKIQNKITKNIYIGESTDIEIRWERHKEDLNNNAHHNRVLQKEFNNFKKEYKENIFDIYNFEVVEEMIDANVGDMKLKEDEYILKIRYDDKYKECGGYIQATNLELYERKYKDAIIGYNYINFHRDLHNYFQEKISKKRECELKKIEKQLNGFLFKLEYKGKVIETKWELTNHPDEFSYWSYLYKNNKDINKTVFKDITLKDICNYLYFHTYTITECKKVLSILINNELIKTDIKLNKLKSDTKFTIELINIENTFDFMESFLTKKCFDREYKIYSI